MKLTRLHAIAISRLQFCTFFPPTYESIANLIRNHFRYWAECGGRWRRRNSNDSYFSWLFHDNEGEPKGQWRKLSIFPLFHTNFFSSFRWAIAMRINFQFPFHFLNSGTYEIENISKLWAISILHLIKLYENFFFMIFSERFSLKRIFIDFS